MSLVYVGDCMKKIVVMFVYGFGVVSAQDVFKVPLGLPTEPWPTNNPYTEKKAELGRILYFDRRLSADGKINCASCHSSGAGFADYRPLSRGTLGREGSRHAPTVINAGYQTLLFWDGRAKSLEEQVLGPVGNPKEMALVEDPHEAYQLCEERIRDIPGYHPLFKAVFGNDDITMDQISQAIATFERTIVSGNSPYDRYMAGDKSAMTEEQIYGYEVFKRSKCNECHKEPLFSDKEFHNIGIGMDAEKPDLGRYVITKDDKDWGAFKTPTLRESTKTFPYMHNGSKKKLSDVIDFYDKGGTPNKNLDKKIHPLNLSEKDKAALMSFLKSLEGEGWQKFSAPGKFPQ